ncbi:hypothetical protein [Streptococcus equi]|nr:hypothetical protein [Streptococcus equi]WKF65922.1 hypothetical protein QYM01_06720 [Streptococcus equi subsp. zooepidemicus]
MLLKTVVIEKSGVVITISGKLSGMPSAHSSQDLKRPNQGSIGAL